MEIHNIILIRPAHKESRDSIRKTQNRQKKGAMDETDIPGQASLWLSSTGPRFERSNFLTSICNLRLRLKIAFLTRGKSVFMLHLKWARRETLVIGIEGRIAS